MTNEREGLARLYQELRDEHQKLSEQLYLTRRLHGIETAAERGHDLAQCFIEHHRIDQEGGKFRFYPEKYSRLK